MAHDLLVDQLYDFLLLVPGLQVWKEHRLQDLFPILEEQSSPIKNFKPDILAWHRETNKWFLIEITRGIDRDSEDGRIDALIDKDEDKKAKYHETCLLLQRHTEGGEVEQLNFVMGIKGSIIESRWRDNLLRLGIQSQTHRRTRSDGSMCKSKPQVTQEEVIKAMIRKPNV